jgi:cytochrome c-type biogenesis protein CcmH
VPLAAEKGPSPQDVQAADAMPPADRTAMIRGMVDGLASCLERSPSDADGWIRLIRSRVVLGKVSLARQALDRGLATDAPERNPHRRRTWGLVSSRRGRKARTTGDRRATRALLRKRDW